MPDDVPQITRVTPGETEADCLGLIEHIERSVGGSTRHGQQIGGIGGYHIAGKTIAADRQDRVDKFGNAWVQTHLFFQQVLVGHAVEPAIEIVASVIFLALLIRANHVLSEIFRPWRIFQFVTPRIFDPTHVFEKVTGIEPAFGPVHGFKTVQRSLYIRTADRRLCELKFGRHTGGLPYFIGQAVMTSRQNKAV